MKDPKDHVVMEQNLHQAFDEIRNSLRAMILLADTEVFPKDMTKKFVDSVVGAMGEAQEFICETCRAAEKCPTKNNFSDHLKSAGYDVLESELGKLGMIEKKVVPLDFSTKFLEN